MMADWQIEINLSDVFDDDNFAPIQEKGKQTAEILLKSIVKVKEHELFDEDDIEFLENLADQFKLINSEDDEYSGIDEFDNLMDELYDWGDYPLDDNFGWYSKKRAWINT
jgi:hypothetical protein